MNELQVIEQKMVIVYGSEIIAVKTYDGKINAGVRWICEGIGMTEGQRKGQIAKIQEDVVLSKGGRKIILPTNGGLQEVFCIELDFLPLWLAKINAGIIEDLELQERVVQYQLKAKDVLANAFIKQVPSTIEDAVIYSMQELKAVKQTQSEHGYEISKLKLVVDNEVWVTEHQKSELRTAVNRRVINLKDDGYEAHYQAIYGALKRHFGVAKYDKIPRKDFETALKFVHGWYPPERQNSLGL